MWPFEHTVELASSSFHLEMRLFAIDVSELTIQQRQYAF